MVCWQVEADTKKMVDALWHELERGTSVLSLLPDGRVLCQAVLANVRIRLTPSEGPSEARVTGETAEMAQVPQAALAAQAEAAHRLLHRVPSARVAAGVFAFPLPVHTEPLKGAAHAVSSAIPGVDLVMSDVTIDPGSLTSEVKTAQEARFPGLLSETTIHSMEARVPYAALRPERTTREAVR